MKKAIVFLADGCEMVEALTPVDMLRRAGIEVETVSVNGKKSVISSHNVEITADKVFEEMDELNADAVILPGGMPGTRHLGAHEGVLRTVRSFYESGKCVAAICAAPSVLGGLGILQGKRAVCYPSFEEQLKGAVISTNEVETDGNVITSRGMGTAIPFSMAIISMLESEEKAKAVGQAVIYRLEA